MRKKIQKKKKRTRTPAQKDLSLLAYPQYLAESQVVEELRRKVDRLRVFDSLGKTLTSSLNLNEVLRLVIEEFASLVGTRHLGLALCSDDDRHYYFQFPQNMSLKKRVFPIGQGLVGQAFESPKGRLYTQVMSLAAFDPEVDEEACRQPESMITLPIVSKGRALGVFIMATPRGEKTLSQEHLDLIESFEDYLAIALENATNYEKLQNLSVTDDLTKLYNSRYLPLVLERELSRSKRYEETLSLVFLDLDNFKSVNDQYGHIAGSRLLTEFGDFLYDRIRTTDIGIRYGGDEFVLILPKTSKSEAVVVVKRAIEVLHERRFLNDSGLSIPVTASFGIASYPDDGEDVDELISAADRAMYEVKKSSKDGLCAGSLTASEWKSLKKS